MIIRITVDPIQVALALGFLGPAWCDDSCQQHTNEGEAEDAKDSTHEQSRTNVVGMGGQESTNKYNSKSNNKLLNQVKKLFNGLNVINGSVKEKEKIKQ